MLNNEQELRNQLLTAPPPQSDKYLAAQIAQMENALNTIRTENSSRLVYNSPLIKAIDGLLPKIAAAKQSAALYYQKYQDKSQIILVLQQQCNQVAQAIATQF
jgi:hypothetical protein